MGKINIDLTEISSTINETFRPLLHDQSRTLMLRGGRGSSKSYFWSSKIVYRILNSLDIPDAKHNIIVFRKHSSNTSRSVVKQIKQIIDDWGINNLVEYLRGEKIFKFVDGSQIMVSGLDEAEKIKSVHEPTSTVLEEATEFCLEDYTQIDLSLRGIKPVYYQNILAFNPISTNNWVYDFFYSKGDLPDTKYHLSTFKDNPYVGAEYGERLEQLCGQNTNARKILIEGEWGTLDGLIYSPDQITVDEPGKIESEPVYGIDFGFNNPTALIQINKVNDDTFYLKQLIYQSELITSDIIDKMNALGISKNAFIYADAAAPDQITEIRRAGYNIRAAKKGQGSVLAGINFCKSFKYIVDPGSDDLIKELQSYSWKTDRNNKPLDEPCKDFDHICDGLRYAMVSHYFKNSKRTSVKLFI